MNIWTYVLIGVVVSLLTNFLRKPKAPKGQTVTMPALLAVIGGIGLAFFGALAVWAYADGDRFACYGFLGFTLLGLWLIVAYLNCRITYDENGFSVKNFWGITRTYTYDDITRLKGTKDVKLYVGDRVVRLDDMAVGKTQFLSYAEARYMKAHGGRGIPIKPPNGKKDFDLFNGNVENAGEFIIIYAMLLGFVVFCFGIGIHTALPPKAEDLTYAAVHVERYEVEDDTLWLYVDGEELPFDIWKYTESLTDADAFLQLCDEGASITVGYLSYSEHHKVRYAEDESGAVLLTMEASQAAQKENDREFFLFMGIMAAVLMLFIAFSIYVGRHPERFSPRVVHMFFKEGYIRVNGPVTPLNKKR